MPLAIRLVVVSRPPTMVTMQLATISSSVRRSPSTSAVMKRVDQAVARGFALLARWRSGNRRSSPSTAREHAGEAVGVVLEVAEHLGERDGPVLELDVVLDRHAEHFGRDDGRQRLGEVGQQIHPAGAAGVDVVDQPGGDFLDVVAQTRGRGRA